MKDVQDAQRAVQRIADHIRSASRLGLKKVASHAYRRLVQETPKGYTGQTRRNWKLLNMSSSATSSFQVVNESKIMRFLESGTKAHGARRARALFIPLNRKTALGGTSKASKFGKDFIFAKKVAGIKPMHIAKKRGRIVERQTDRMLRNIINAIKL